MSYEDVDEIKEKLYNAYVDACIIAGNQIKFMPVIVNVLKSNQYTFNVTIDKIIKNNKCVHLEDNRINQLVEKLHDGYAINGCCGGGCFITGIKYCPFCSIKLD